MATSPICWRALVDDQTPPAAAIREFTPQDQDAVRVMVLDGLRERWGSVYRHDVNPDLDDIMASHVDAGADVLVAEAAGKVVACGLVLPESPGLGRILRVSVQREHRRQGVARALVTELVTGARHRGLRTIVVRTDTPWASALALYQSLAFTQTHQDGTDTLFELHL